MHSQRYRLSIAWGGFAERAKLSAYLVFTVLFTAVIYPVIAHWIWSSSGWLFTKGAQDYAGSTVVHLTGAIAAFAATLFLKPRIGRFNKDGSANEILGHNQVFGALSVLILWVGWFGFNAGSALGVGDGFFAYVAFNTQLGAAGGAVAALLISWLVNGKADITTTLNGALAGLVAITATCAFVDPWAAVVIGLVAGVLVFFSSNFSRKSKLMIRSTRFPFTVRQVCGVRLLTVYSQLKSLLEVEVGQGGLIDTGSWHQLWIQVESVVVCGAYTLAASFLVAWHHENSNGLRVLRKSKRLSVLTFPSMARMVILNK